MLNKLVYIDVSVFKNWIDGILDETKKATVDVSSDIVIENICPRSGDQTNLYSGIATIPQKVRNMLLL